MTATPSRGAVYRDQLQWPLRVRIEGHGRQSRAGDDFLQIDRRTLLREPPALQRHQAQGPVARGFVSSKCGDRGDSAHRERRQGSLEFQTLSQSFSAAGDSSRAVAARRYHCVTASASAAYSAGDIRSMRALTGNSPEFGARQSLDHYRGWTTVPGHLKVEVRAERAGTTKG